MLWHMPSALSAFERAEISEVIAQTKTHAYVLDAAGKVRYSEEGTERPSPITIEMPGLSLCLADPTIHRKLDAAEANHTRASMAALKQLAAKEGKAVARAMFWKGSAYHDFARHGRVVVWRYGMNNAFNEKRRLCRGASADVAETFLDMIRAKPPKGFKATSPFYVPKRGCVIRSYASGDKRELRGVVDAEWRAYGGKSLRSFESADKAERAYDAWVHG
jgi:hypothetical protein